MKHCCIYIYAFNPQLRYMSSVGDRYPSDQGCFICIPIFIYLGMQ